MLRMWSTAELTNSLCALCRFHWWWFSTLSIRRQSKNWLEGGYSSWFNLKNSYQFTVSCGLNTSVQKAAGSGHITSVGVFLGCCWFRVGTIAKFGFGFVHFDLLKAVEGHRFGFGCLRCFGGPWGDCWGSGEALAPRTGFEDIDVLDLATPQLRGIGTGSSYLQVDFLNPPRRRGKSKFLDRQ